VSSSQEPLTEGTGADHARSGADVAEAIEVAEQGSAVQETHDEPPSAESGPARVERAAGDPEMTEGQVVLGEGEETGAPSSRVDPRETAGSGGAQSQPGARVSDRASAGEPAPDGPPFTQD
jgi:hypothetical protein